MKGIPTQLQGIIDFINKTLENRTISQTFECYLINLQKATLDTLKVANIAFDNLDNLVPVDVRLTFQKTTNKIKEYIKHKPKGQLEKQDRYTQEFDEVQNYLENRPEIERTNEKERGELFKFLNQAEERQKQNRLLLQNIPKFTYGTSRINSRQHRHYFSDIRSPLGFQNDPNRALGQLIQNTFKKQEDSEQSRRKDNSFAYYVKCENEFTQTDLTLAELQLLVRHRVEPILARQKEPAGKVNIQQKEHKQQKQEKQEATSNKKSKQQKSNKQQASVVVIAQAIAQKQQAKPNVEDSSQISPSLFQHNKKKKLTKIGNKQSFLNQTIRQSQINLTNAQNQSRINQEIANIQYLQLEKIESKEKKAETKGQVKGQTKGKTQEKKEPKSKKNDTSRRDSTFKKIKNGEQYESSRQKKHTDIRESVDKHDKIIQKLNKTKTKQSYGNRSSANFSNLIESQFKSKVKQIHTQTEHLTQIQTNLPELSKQTNARLELLKQDEYQNVQSIKKKSSSLQKINNLSQPSRNKDRKHNQFTKRERTLKKIIQQNDSELSKTKNIIDLNENQGKEANYQDPVNQYHQQGEQPLLPSIIDKLNKSSKFDGLTTKLSNFSLTNVRESGETKDLKKTKINLSQFHMSMHTNFNQNLKEKYGNLTMYKKDNQRSLQLLPAIRQDQENEQYKDREMFLSKDKEQQLQKETNRLLDQIQDGTTQKKGRSVEWIKVIRDIRQYEHLHLRYCGENCVHLVKFYEFLKKKNLSMYINRKQLYVHKQNIEIKPNLI